MSHPTLPLRSVGCLLAIASSLAGCVHYQARPLAPDATLGAIDARRLDDPGLARAAAPANLVRSWPPDVWDLPALTAAALYFHPDLAVARANWDVARAGLVTAGERPNPGVTPGAGRNASTPPGTITPWILNLDFDFTLETAGKRGRRIDQARQLAASARYQVADAAWQVRAGVRQALLDLFAATETAALVERQRTVVDANLALLQRQLDAGEISAFQLSQGRLQRDALRLAAADARSRGQDARARLATAVGLPASALDGVRLGFEAFRQAPVTLPGDAARVEALLNRPDLLAALSDYEASQAALQLEIAKQYPDIHLGPGYQMDQDSHKWSLLFPLTLPVFSRNLGPIGEAEARRTLAAARVEAVQARAIGDLDRALAAYRSALDTVAVADQVVTEARRAQATAERQFAAGEISRLDLGIVQSDLLTRELARLDAAVKAQQALGDIENAMQRPADLPLSPLPGNQP
ncbi:MAG: TolC family protein [Vicinamibacterales bacterium]